ncbi:MAG TPA: hypothetical protein VN495_04345 [Candidatus Paceibacterota bacterium]|nr:hypothetical protein [Candidatus Paceibacterota bacterium]
MSNFFISSIAAVSIMVLGMYLAYLYGRHTKKFRWREYAALLMAPLGIVLWFAWFEGSKVLYFFLQAQSLGWHSNG